MSKIGIRALEGLSGVEVVEQKENTNKIKIKKAFGGGFKKGMEK